MDKEIELLKRLIDESHHIVFFTGAGVSTESGIKDFRSEDGLYNLKSKYGKPYEVMLSHTYFFEETDTFFKFYKEFMINKGARPNYAHKYMARLESEKDVCVITQNIDGLHQEAGSKNVVELHGSIHRNRCVRCNKFYSLEDILKMDGAPRCDECGGIIKPEVILYEEPLNDSSIYMAVNKISKADLFIIAGTSLKVYPASGLINYYNGKNVVVINKEHLYLGNMVTLEINKPVGEVFKLVDNVSK